jgi:hypothetical protein
LPPLTAGKEKHINENQACLSISEVCGSMLFCCSVFGKNHFLTAKKVFDSVDIFALSNMAKFGGTRSPP